MHTIRFGYLRTPDGVRLRYGHCPVEQGNCRGTVVVLGGRTEFVEKYLETIQELHVRGFNVFSLDWRGQGLSERLLKDRTRGYVRTYEHYVSDFNLLLDEIIFKISHRPLIVMAHSMGAHIILHFLNRDPQSIDKAVLMSPMVNIRTNPVPKPFARWCSRLFVRIGLEGANIPMLKRNDHYHRSFQRNWLTHDPVRFHHVKQLIARNSQLAVHSITFGWLAATFAAIDQLHQPGFFQNITTPVLLVAAGSDRVVSNGAIRQLATQLPRCHLMTLHGAHHEILQERDTLRSQFWQAFDNFV